VVLNGHWTVLLVNLILTHHLYNLSCVPRVEKKSSSLLLAFLLNDNLPPAFLSELVFRTSDDPDTFTPVFEPILRGLVLTMRRLSFDTHDYKQPLVVLSALCDIKVGNTRPLCNLVSFVTVLLCLLFYIDRMLDSRVNLIKLPVKISVFNQQTLINSFMLESHIVYHFEI